MAKTYRSRLNRKPSKLRIKIVPAATVILGSMITAFPIITNYPILPPLGLLALLAWRLIRPEHWAVWAGLPLGMVDDMFSGQPFGSAVLLWSIVLIALETIENRVMNRDYWQDWLIAALSIIFVLICGMLIIDFQSNLLRLEILVPQIILSVLLYPFIARLIGAIDNWRVAV